MPAAVDTGRGSGPSDTGDEDRYLQLLLRELCQLQAKYTFPEAPPCACPSLSAVCRGLSVRDRAKMPAEARPWDGRGGQ